MGRRTFSPEFKLEAVKLVRERGVKIGQAAQDLGLHENVLRKWVKDHGANGGHAFPGRGKQGPDDAEISRLRREVAKTKTSVPPDPILSQNSPSGWSGFSRAGQSVLGRLCSISNPISLHTHRTEHG